MKIANLGSSFAAGPGIKPAAERSAGRSASNYAHLLAQRLDAELIDLSVSGATLLTILNESQAFMGHKFAPQIEGVPEDSDLVLILGGGNDIGYVLGIMMESVEAYWLGRMVVGAWRYWYGADSSSEIGEKELAERYGTVVDAIHAKAPKAKVIVVEYLTLLGSDIKPGVDVPFAIESVQKHRDVAAMLQRATAAAVDGRKMWCKRVPTAERSQEHGIGSAEPWVWGFGLQATIGGAMYHPNADGMKAVAEMIYEEISAGG